MRCNTCGSESIRVTTRTVREGSDIQTVDSCNACDGYSVNAGFLKDANGDRIVWNDSLNGKFNYCLGEVVTSKRHLHEILRKNNLMQKGDLVKNKDWMGRSV